MQNGNSSKENKLESVLGGPRKGTGTGSSRQLHLVLGVSLDEQLKLKKDLDLLEWGQRRPST